MSSDPYGPLESPAQQTPAPQVRDLYEQQPAGYLYPDANEYAYGPPPQAGYGQPGPYGAPPPYGYPPMVQYGWTRPLIDDPNGPDAPLRGASPMEAYQRFWKRGATFTGRASASEYWWPTLINSVIGGALGFGTLWPVFVHSHADPNWWMMLFGLLFWLAVLIPGIALMIRRLHDAGYAGAMWLLSFVPYLGGLIMLVFMLQPAKPDGARFDAVNRL